MGSGSTDRGVAAELLMFPGYLQVAGLFKPTAVSPGRSFVQKRKGVVDDVEKSTSGRRFGELFLSLFFLGINFVDEWNLKFWLCGMVTPLMKFTRRPLSHQSMFMNVSGAGESALGWAAWG